MTKHLENVTFSVTPDPMVRGEQAVIVVRGITATDYLNVLVADGMSLADYLVGYAVDGVVQCSHRPIAVGSHTVELRAKRHGSWVTLASAALVAVAP